MFKYSPFRTIYKKKNLETLANLADEELVIKYRKRNDPEIVTILLSRYSDYVTGMSINYLGNEEDVRDFIQELYLKLAGKLKAAEIRNFRSWLLTSVKNLLIDTGRRRKTRLMHLENFYSETSDIVHLRDYDKQPGIEEIINSFEILNEKEKRCIEELYLNDKSYHEVMKDNKWSYNEVRGYRDRAIKKLRTHISKTRELLEHDISGRG